MDNAEFDRRVEVVEDVLYQLKESGYADVTDVRAIDDCLAMKAELKVELYGMLLGWNTPAADIKPVADTERAPGVCPICLRRSTIRSGPQQWDCTSRRCNSQFFVDNEGLLAVRDRVPHLAMHPVLQPRFTAIDMAICAFLAAIVLAVAVVYTIKG